MTDVPDGRLLELFARNGSEEAFAALVRRHIGLVHSVALRHTAQPQQAEDITQAVFIILARKAGSLGRRTVLPGWLYHTARLTAANWQRAEARRLRREQEAFMQSTIEVSPTDTLWRELGPQLDEAMAGLGAAERDALVLRYFQNKSMAEVGQSLGLAENTAQKRIGRALEKLRRFFARRGVDSTAGNIADTISTHSVQAVPAALVKSVTAAALAKGAAASTSTLTIVKGALKIMAWTKAKTAVVTGMAILFAATTTTVALKEIQQHKLDDSWRTQDVFAMFKKVDEVPPQVRILPSKFHPTKSRPLGDWTDQHNKAIGAAVPAEAIVRAAYGCDLPDRLVLAASLPAGRYDFIANLPDGNQEALQRILRQKLGVAAKWEMMETNVLLLKVKTPNSPGLSPTAKKHRPGEMFGTTSYTVFDKPLTNLVNFLEAQSGIPVVDQTTLTGHFDFALKWSEPPGLHSGVLPGSLSEALATQLGLEVVPGTAPVEMLVVEKAK